MSLYQQLSSPPLRRAHPNPTTHQDHHPFTPLTAAEIRHASALVKSLWPSSSASAAVAVEIHFKAVTLMEPAKKEMVPFLEAEQHGQAGVRIDRRAWVNYCLRNTVRQL
jgi:primary-amine oxidase